MNSIIDISFRTGLSKLLKLTAKFLNFNFHVLTVQNYQSFKKLNMIRTCISLSLNFRYDPKTDTWTMVAPLSMPRDAVGVCLLGDRLYAVGGYDGQTYLNTMESYDPQTNEWTQVRLIWK